MNSSLQKLIKEAENDTWQKLNSYRTLVEALTNTKTELFAICLASRIINYCIEQCEQADHSELKEKFANLLDERLK